MKNILEAKNLVKEYSQTQGFFSRTKNIIRALSQVSISIEKGKTLAVVGESGSGKSTLAKSLIKLIEVDDGSIYFEGCLLYTSPSPRDQRGSRMPSSA